MNKIKLLMLLILAATGMTVSAADAGYEFVESDGGKTLTIKGYGDLTTCSQTSTTTVFSAAANGNVFTNNSGTSVTPQAAYNPSAKYYYATREYTQVFNGGAPTDGTYAYYVNTTTTWSEAAKSLHIYDIYYNGTNFGREGEINNLSNTNSGYINNSLSLATGKSEPVIWAHYYVYSTSEIPWGTDLIPGTNCYFVNSDIVNASTTYYAGSNLYRSQDGGKTKELLVKDQQYTYNPDDLFYIPDGNVTYTQIADNAKYFAAHPSYLEDKETVTTFKDALLAKIKSRAYTKVVFDNTGSDELLIDPAISLAILFPYIQAESYGYYSTNTNIETLDMGEATLKLSEGQSYSDIITNPDNVNYLCNLTNFTIPMMPKDEDGKMVLPDFALSAKFPGDSNLGTLTVPVGYTELGNGSLALNAKITTINLPEGLKKIDNQAFSMNTALTNLNLTGVPVEGRSIVLPSSLEEIGKEAFGGCTALTSTADDPFILPSGLKKVKASAFINLTNLKFLQLNEGLEYVGNTAFGLDHEVHDQTTITFPSTIKYLGPGSFISRWYQDIYFTGETAPVCPVGKPAFSDWGNVTAFSANTQMGNNGFNPYLTEGSTADNAQQGYANRENYINNGYYFTILHFPTGLTSDQAKTYRDITRRYVTGNFTEDGEFQFAGYGANIADAIDPATGKTFGSAFKESADGEKSSLVYYMSGKDAPLYSYTYSGNVQPGYIDTYLGSQQIWPSQAQWTRNFVTVANGVEWDGEKKYRPTVTEEMFNMMKEDGLYVKANSLDYSTKRVADANNGNGYGKVFDISTMTWGELNDDEKDYLSLILYQGTRRFVLGNDSPYDIPFKMKMEAGRWWSICLPFNMTKKQINEVFGEGTHVCLFSGVKRNDGDDKLLRLEFINDVYHHKTERTVEKLGDGSALKYTYGANYSTSNPEPADDDIVIYARESYMIYPTEKSGDAAGVAVRNFGTPDFTIGDPLPTMIQANSNTPYTIGGPDAAYRFIGNFNSTASYSSDGKPVTVKIPQYSYGYGTLNGGETKFFILNTDKATWSPFKSIVQNLARNGGEEDWNNFFQKSSTGAKQVSIFGLDEYLTGVENVIIEASSDNGADKAVYSINGSYVGDSLQGLAPGVYVKQGKAYIVK